MIVTCVYVKVKPENMQEFIAASELNHLESVNEPGNIRFDLCQMADDPCSFLLYEAYESEEASAAHKTTPHYAKWRDTVAGMMAEPRKGVKYRILNPVK
jgi:autoinducer 2-degrading protein